MSKKQPVGIDAQESIAALADQVTLNYIEYGKYVIEQRAIPDFRDGSKPSQRRALYAMYRLGAWFDGRYYKSARVVGDTIGKFHPHGDVAVYGTVVNMAHARYPLVKGQGNFGDVQDPPAAARYTECKMTKLAEEHFSDIAVAETVPNYSEDDTEPLVVNTRLPLLLMNGADGVAVGITAHIPSHNLREVVAALEHVLRNFNTANPASITTLLRGPDCVRGGILLSKPEEVAAVYGRGEGQLSFQCEYRFNNEGATTQVIVFGFPDAFGIEPFIKKCSQLVLEKRLKYVETDFELSPGSKSQDDKRFIIRVGAENKPALERVIEMLKCQQSYQFNVTVRRDDMVELKSMNIVGLMKAWLTWRSEEEKKILNLTRTEKQRTLFREQTRLLAAVHLKLVIAALEQETETTELYLQRVLKISDEAAKLIVDMKVGDLRKANVDAQNRKILGLQKEIAALDDDLLHIPRVIIQHLHALSPFYDERRTRIGARGPQLSRIEADGDPTVVAASAEGKLYSIDETGTTQATLMPVGTYEGVAVFGATNVVGLFSPSEMAGKAGTGLESIVGIAPVEADYFIGVGQNGCVSKILPVEKSFACFIKDTPLVFGGGAWSNSTLLLWGNKEFAAIRVTDLHETRKNTKGTKAVRFRPIRALLVRDDQHLLTASGKSVGLHREGLQNAPLFVVGARNAVQYKTGRRRFLDLRAAQTEIAKGDVIVAQDVTLPKN